MTKKNIKEIRGSTFRKFIGDVPTSFLRSMGSGLDTQTQLDLDRMVDRVYNVLMSNIQTAIKSGMYDLGPIGSSSDSSSSKSTDTSKTNDQAPDDQSKTSSKTPAEKQSKAAELARTSMKPMDKPQIGQKMGDVLSKLPMSKSSASTTASSSSRKEPMWDIDGVSTTSGTKTTAPTPTPTTATAPRAVPTTAPTPTTATAPRAVPTTAPTPTTATAPSTATMAKQSQGQALDLDAYKKRREGERAAGIQAQQYAQSQMKQTAASNLATSRADNELVSRVRAEKQKPGFQQNKGLIRQAAVKGIHETRYEKLDALFESIITVLEDTKTQSKVPLSKYIYDTVFNMISDTDKLDGRQIKFVKNIAKEIQNGYASKKSILKDKVEQLSDVVVNLLSTSTTQEKDDQQQTQKDDQQQTQKDDQQQTQAQEKKKIDPKETIKKLTEYIDGVLQKVRTVGFKYMDTPTFKNNIYDVIKNIHGATNNNKSIRSLDTIIKEIDTIYLNKNPKSIPYDYIDKLNTKLKDVLKSIH